MVTPRRPWPVLILALLAGCSAPKLAYNNLDWLVGWQVGRYVDLQPPQKALLESGFRAFWGWHRSTQLRLYAKDLRELAATAERPLQPEQVSGYVVRTGEHAMRALREATPDVARMLASMDDAQVAAMLERLAERRRERYEEEDELDAEELQEKAQEQMEKNLKRWIGSLSRGQKDRVAAWTRERQYAGSIWRQYEEDWAALFAELLTHRRAPGFEARLAQLFQEPKLPHRAQMSQMQAHNRAVWIRMLADISGSLSESQRRLFQERLRELASDFDELAAETAATPATRPSPAALQGSIG